MTTPSPYKVTISLANAGSVAAFATVEGRTMKINGFRVMKKKDGSGVFFAEPSYKSGERWLPIIEFLNKAHRQSISDAIMAAYNEVAKAQEAGGGDDGAAF